MTEAKKPPVICKECGVTMNYHAEKLVDPTNAQDVKRVDPKLGGLIEEMHTCPGCGRVDSRHGE